MRASRGEAFARGERIARSYAQAGQRKARILAADDNLTNRMVLQALLKDMPVELTVVEHGQAAVDAWAAESFDLILMDAFSPSHCPELWSEEFLGGLAQKLAPGGRLLTYSRAASIRGSLQRAGLDVQTLRGLR